MTEEEDMAEMMEIAKRKGEARKELEKRNKKRRAKGRKPLPDEQEKADMNVLRRKYRTADATTVDGASAIKLFEMRKTQMEDPEDADLDDEKDVLAPSPEPLRRKESPTSESAAEEEKARKEAESVRRVQDLKNGRIDHEGNWSAGQRLEGGDKTEFPAPAASATPASDSVDGTAPAPSILDDPDPSLKEFMHDLYGRLRVSFSGIESTLSDLQGRVAEIVTASARPVEDDDGKDEFEKLLSQRMPVTFDVGGTKMTFDAITVFHASPCITVVSKSGSATIMPKPGATLRLTYDMGGEKYVDDPVTFLGTRFDLPMFGLSFVGFIRDEEASALDVAAGVSED